METEHELALRSVADVRAAFEACGDSKTNLVRRARLRRASMILVLDGSWVALFAAVFGVAGIAFGLVIPMLTVSQALLTRAYFESGALHLRGFDCADYRIDTLLRLERVGDHVRLAFTHGPDGSPSNPALEVDGLEPLVRLFEGSTRLEVTA